MVEVFQTVDVVALVVTILPVPNAIVRATALADENKPVVNVKLLRFNVPAVSVTVEVELTLKLDNSCQEPPVPLNVTGALITAPLVKTVLAVVAVNVTVPVLFQTVLESIAILLATDKVGVVPVLKVTVPPVETVISRQANAPVIVTANDPPELASKNTESAAVGTVATVVPPLVVRQLVVVVVSHVPAPPTQYLFAIFNLY
jgi:hypothetical protein